MLWVFALFSLRLNSLGDITSLKMDQNGAEPWPERNSSRVLSHVPHIRLLIIHLNPPLPLCAPPNRVSRFRMGGLAAAFAAVLSALAALEAGETGADTAADGTLLALTTTHVGSGVHAHGLDGTRLLGANSRRGLGSHLLGDHLGLGRRHYCGLY